MILTDSPVKKMLQEEESAAKSKKKCTEKKKPLKKLTNQKKPTNQDSDTTQCLICCDTFKNSRPNEIWIQCFTCKGWAHEMCTSSLNKKVWNCEMCI